MGICYIVFIYMISMVSSGRGVAMVIGALATLVRKTCVREPASTYLNYLCYIFFRLFVCMCVLFYFKVVNVVNAGLYLSDFHWGVRVSTGD